MNVSIRWKALVLWSSFVFTTSSAMFLFQELDPPEGGGGPTQALWAIVTPSANPDIKRYSHTSGIVTSGTKVDGIFGKIQLGHLNPVTIVDESLVGVSGETWPHQFSPPEGGWSMPNKTWNANSNEWEKLYVIALFSDNGAGGFEPEHQTSIYVTSQP